MVYICSRNQAKGQREQSNELQVHMMGIVSIDLLDLHFLLWQPNSNQGSLVLRWNFALSWLGATQMSLLSWHVPPGTSWRTRWNPWVTQDRRTVMQELAGQFS